MSTPSGEHDIFYCARAKKFKVNINIQEFKIDKNIYHYYKAFKRLLLKICYNALVFVQSQNINNSKTTNINTFHNGKIGSLGVTYS